MKINYSQTGSNTSCKEALVINHVLQSVIFNGIPAIPPDWGDVSVRL